MSEILKRNHAGYIFTYENAKFKVFKDIDPDMPIHEEALVIKNEKDFEIELMWQYEQIKAKYEVVEDDFRQF
jgi:hypothetical protein